MGLQKRKIKILVWVLTISLMGVLLSGCGTSRSKKSSSKSGPPALTAFGDVQVPGELKVIKKSSFVFRTPELSAGVLSLKGRVEVGSLIAFFDTNMAKDNWELVSSFRSHRSIILFHKENRWCVINISESKLSTYVEIWVSPTTSKVPVEMLKGS